MTVSLTQKEAVKEILFILSDLMKTPQEDVFNDLADGTIQRTLNELIQMSSLTIENIEWVEVPQSFSDMQQLYQKCFTGIVKPFAAPIESIYKPWTIDPSNSIMGGRKGLIMGDPAHHILYLLDELQLELPPEYSTTPDHLAILLELAAYFVENGSQETLDQFITDHFDWLDDFKAELAKVDQSQFFLQVVETIASVIHANTN